MIRRCGGRCVGDAVLSRGCPSLAHNGCRAAALALVAGHDESRRARKRGQGGGSERRAYSLAPDIVRETEERLRSVSRRVAGAGDASVAGQVKLCCCATCC